MCENMRKYLVVFLFLFFKAIMKDRTPIGVDLGVFVLGLVGPTPESTRTKNSLCQTADLQNQKDPFHQAVAENASR